MKIIRLLLMNSIDDIVSICFFFLLLFFRAIDLVQRHPQYLEVVVGYRQKYLKDYGGDKKETNTKYIQAMKTVRS
jgi:hypothetical protein